MRAHINLLTRLPKPSVVRLNVYIQLRILVAFWVLLLIYFSYQYIAIKQDLKQLQSTRDEQMQMTNNMMNLQKTHPEIEGLLNLQQANEKLQQRIDLLQTKINLEQRQRQGFSEDLKRLANSSVAGVWLTNFELSRKEQRLNLKGNTLESDRLSMFLQKIQQNKLIDKPEVKQLQLTNTDQENIQTFEITGALSHG